MGYQCPICHLKAVAAKEKPPKPPSAKDEAGKQASSAVDASSTTRMKARALQKPRTHGVLKTTPLLNIFKFACFATALKLSKLKSEQS